MRTWYILEKNLGRPNSTAHRTVDCTWMNKRNHPYPKKVIATSNLGVQSPCRHCAFEEWVEWYGKDLHHYRGLIPWFNRLIAAYNRRTGSSIAAFK